MAPKASSDHVQKQKRGPYGEAPRQRVEGGKKKIEAHDRETEKKALEASFCLEPYLRIQHA